MHHLNPSPFNNHRRSVHKALSTPCFLLPSLPWRSSGEKVPPPLPPCISPPRANTRGRTLRCRAVIIFPGEPKGHCDGRELEWNPSVPSPFIQSRPSHQEDPHLAVALLCHRLHKKGADDSDEESVFQIVRKPCGQTAIILRFHFVQQNDSAPTLLPKGSGRFCPPHHGVHVQCLNSRMDRPHCCFPRAAMCDFVAHYSFACTHSDMTPSELK